MAPLVPVAIRCTYRDPDGTLSSDGNVTARVVGRSRVPSASTVVSGDSGWALVNGALPSSAQLLAPPSGTLIYQMIERVEGYTSTYLLPVTAADATNGIDLSTWQTNTDPGVATQAFPGTKGDPGDVSAAQLAAGLATKGPLPEAATATVTAAQTASALAGKTTRYALTAPVSQPLPAISDGLLVAVAVTAASTANLTVTAAGTDVFGDGTAQTSLLQPGDYYLARGQVVPGDPNRWRRVSGPLLGETDTHNDVRYPPTPQLARYTARDRGARVNALLAESLPGAGIGAVSAADAGSTLTGAVEVPAYDRANSRLQPAMRFTQAKAKQASSSYPLYDGIVASGLTSPQSNIIVAAEFFYDGSAFDLHFLDQGSSLVRYRVFADALIVGTVTGGSSPGYPVRATVTFPDARPRFVKVEVGYGSGLLGITRQGSASVSYPSSRPKGPRVIVVGDSYTEGVGAPSQFVAYPNRLATAMEWTDLWASGSGGTGYLNPGANGRVKFRDRVQTDVIDQSPDIVIIAGGINDQSYASAAAVGTEAGVLYDAILAGLPNVDLRVVGPWNPYASAPPANLGPTRDAIKAAARARDLMFVDPMADSWFTDANKATMIDVDNIHPTTAGHRYVGDRLAGYMRSLVSW